MRALDRARTDIAAGALWKARDRLHGAVRTAPTNQEVLVLLGQTLFDMGDLPAAGRYWYLTTIQSDDAARAAMALAERYGHNEATMALALPVRAELEAFPTEVQARLTALAERVKRQSKVDVLQTWGPPKGRGEMNPPRKPLSRAFDFVLAFTFIGLFLLVLVLGVLSLIGHVNSLFNY